VSVSELFRLSLAQSGVAAVLLNVGFGEKSGHRIFAAGGDVFVPARAVERTGLGTLSEGQRISSGDLAHDAALLRDLEAEIHIPVKAVLAKMKAYCHPSNGTVN
jgi:hypothetical protein